jgi:hypothetical protein
MVEGHARHATGLKPWALAQGVGSFYLLRPKKTVFVQEIAPKI